VLSFLNTSSAAWFAVSGKEGTFKRLMGSIVFRLVALVVILLLFILKAGLDPIPLMISFILFFLFHQISLILWLKREIRRTHSTLYPKGKGEDHA
jgi:protein-S-isoprenylcysteine O-methyltransferase Ste14